MILILSLFLAALAGFSMNRASICTVKAVAELFSSRKAFMFISFGKTIIWIELVTVLLMWLCPDTSVHHQVFEFSWLAIAGGLVFGIGAALNRGCAFSTLSRLGEGELAMLVTVSAMVIGAQMIDSIPGLPMRLDQRTFPAHDQPVAAAALLLLISSAWALREIFRLWQARPSGASLARMFLAARYRLAASAAVIGISNGVLYVLYGSWTYTSAIERELRGLTGHGAEPGLVEWLLFASAWAGVTLSALQRGHLSLDWRPSVAWMWNFLGGLLMGAGTALAPGGNDALLLQGIPSLSPHAVPAYLAMVFGIAIVLVVVRMITGGYMQVRCAGDVCLVENHGKGRRTTEDRSLVDLASPD